MKRLAIITTHPVQYYAPVFKLLHTRKRIEIKVFYTWGQQVMDKYDPGFKKNISWDIPLLDGYHYEWATNTATDPGSHHFNGIINPDLAKQIENWMPDAVLVFGWAFRGHLSVMRYFKNKTPIFFRGDSTMLDRTTGIKFSLKTLLLKYVYQKVDVAFYVGQNNKAYFKAAGLHDNQLIYAPHAVDNDRFSVEHEQEAQSIRKSIKVLPNDSLILFAGKFESKKNPLILLEAFKKISPGNLHLLFVGNGHLEADLKIAANGRNNIHFMDFKNQAEMPAIYQAADIFCLPSAGPGETWGLAVNEAMAAGRAVLVSDKVGCAFDLVCDSVNGEVFNYRSVNNLSNALLRLTASKENLQEMGQQSQKIIQPFNFTAIAEAIEETVISFSAHGS